MKLLYAHDHKFYKYDNNYYSNGSFPKEALCRYTNIFKNMKFVSRQVESDNKPHKMSLASTESVDFIKIPDFKSIKTYHKKIEAIKIINKEVKEADCVIARLPSSIGAIAVSCAKKNNKPYLIEVVACPWDALWNHSLKGKLLAPFIFITTKKVVRNAQYVVYVTNEFLQNRYPTKGKNTNCSNVALTQFDDNILENRLEKISNMQEKDKIILGTTAAVDVRFKGQQYVIKALGKLKEQGITNFEYQLVGIGSQKYLKAVAKKYDVTEQVKFLGTMPHDKVFKWLETIDIYVQPSRQEGLPRALIEAMSRGIPAFGARTAGIPELLESEFIFSNTNKNIDEICRILKMFDKNIMMQQAKKNYDESKKYDKGIIEERRKKFFGEFVVSLKQ
jgi:glycosyltransferase involved in cell wall biosynthesis